MPALTQGPLPARVYWTRRIMVIGTALLLVFAIARLLGDSSDASSSGDGDAASLSADSSSSSSAATEDSTSSTPSTGPTKKGKPGKAGQPIQTPTSQAPVLALPEGTCADSDIAVTPSVENAVGGRDVTVVLQLRTMSSPACTWRVSADTLTLGITSGDDAIWSTRQCRRAIPRQDVVVRKDVTTEVSIVWKQAKRSDEECSSRTDWAEAGWYHATAAALGGEPSDVQFELTTPTAATITVTATPKQDPTKKPGKAKPGDKPTKKPGKPSSDEPTGEPSGSVD